MSDLSDGAFVAAPNNDDAWISSDATCADFGVADDTNGGAA